MVQHNVIHHKRNFQLSIYNLSIYFMSKKFFLIGLFSIVLCFSLATAVFADEFGLDVTAEHAGLKGYGSDLPKILGQVVGTALSIVGVVFFALMIYGGFLWMQARGNEEYTKKGLDTIIAAIIGLIIVMASYAITNFVFKAVVPVAPVGGGGGGGGDDGIIPGEEPTISCVQSSDCPANTPNCKIANPSMPGVCVGCETNEDCGTGKTCDMAGKCVVTQGGICVSTADCDGSMICSKDSTCEIPVAGAPCVKGTDHCGKNLVCISAVCKVPAANDPCDKGSTDQCGTDLKCVQKAAGSSEWVCAAPGFGDSFCVTDKDCRVDHKCAGSKCSPRVSGDTCISPTDCQYGGANANLMCVSGKCKDGSDGVRCNTSTDCRSTLCFDVDGDGKVWNVCGQPQVTGKNCAVGDQCSSGTCNKGKCT